MEKIIFNLVFGWLLDQPGQNVVPRKGDIDLTYQCIRIWSSFARTGKCAWSVFNDLNDVKILSNQASHREYDPETDEKKTDIFERAFNLRSKNFQ